MSRLERIRASLTQALAPSQLEVIDDSHKHAGHVGARPEGETHFTVRIQSNAFTGLSKVAAHQRIYALLADEFKTGLHALAIEVLS